MLIKELVKLDEQGKFISAVQVSDYDNPLDNLSLVKSYIFANNAPDTHLGQSRAVGSVDLLKEVRLSYINGSANRFVVIANYGHGKSHLALVLANYFAKPYESPEVQEILGRISHTLSHNQPEAENFREFKRQYDRFLVIRLRGDTPRVLREQFFPAIKSALREHPATKNAELPFWNHQATQWLQSKVNDPQSRQFLKDQLGTDFPNLLQDVEGNKQEAYEQYVQLFEHLNNGVAPNAEGNFSLREAITWVVDTFCKNAKPLAGVVVLFDEFSQYIERYSQGKAIGELQQMLEGIGERRGQAMFLAFAQHDPDEVAERVQGGQSLQNIKRELGRIDRKYALYSLMESVLDAYLAQSEPVWAKFLQENQRARGGLVQATELVWETYLKRYDKELRWTNEKFREVITKGCFPLHPLTTALLCHLKMQQGLDDDARTILRFVRNRFEFKQNEPMIVEEKINWILPIDLLDYFGARIAKPQDYDAYENAVQNLEQVFGDKATKTHFDILKALLLQFADGLHFAGERQIELLSQMTGLDYSTTVQILKELGKNTITKFDENTKGNSFWPIAANPKALEQKIRDHINDKKFGVDELFELNRIRGTLFPGADHIEVNIAWGTSLEWAANTAIITKENLTTQYLQDLVKPYKLTFQGLQDGNRGLVIWLMALDDTDIEYFLQNTNQVLQEAFPSETPPPILLVLPSQTHKSIADQFLRYQALEQISKDKEAIKEIGQVAFDVEFERIKKSLYKSLGILLGDEQKFTSVLRKSQSIIVPQRYKANLLVLATVNLQSVLQKLYELAYPYRPPEFFTDLNGNPKKGSSPLRDAVKAISKNLIFNRIPALVVTGMTPVGQRVCRDNLLAKWHLLSTTYYIQEPDVLSLRRAWDYLDTQIKPDEQTVYAKDFIPNLFNGPFGFDYNTATLLLTAWIGKHNTELRFYAKNKVVGLEYLEKLVEQGNPQDFLSNICTIESLAFSRRDADKALTEGRSLVESIQKGIVRSQAQAESDINALSEIVNQGICPEDEKGVFAQAIVDLTSGLETARQYDKNAKKLLVSISGENDVRKLLELKDDLKRLTEVVLALPEQPSNTQIEEELGQQLEKAVDAASVRAENLTRIEGADSARNSLKECKELLKRHGLLDLVQVVSMAESKLDARIKELKGVDEERALINQINSMTASADLAKLYEYKKNLIEMGNGSVKVIEQKDRKLSAIQNEISALDAFAVNAMKFATDSSREQMRSRYDEILSRANRYAGTQYETSLNQAKQYLSQLRDFLNELQSIENRAKFFRTPDDAQEILISIEQVSTKYSEKLGQNHRMLIESARLDIESRVQAEYLKSGQHINAIALELESPSVKLSEIKTKLDRITGFVTPALSAQIELLRKKLAEREVENQRVQNEKAEQDRIARLQKQDEESTLNQINAKKLNADLATLYGYVEDLQTLSNSSPTIEKARSQKLSDIKSKISQLEIFAATVSKTFISANREQTDSLLKEIKGKDWQYIGTEYEASLNQAKKYLEELNTFFHELKEIEKPLLQTPEDMHNFKATIEQIITKYDDEIIRNHRADVENIQRDAEKRVEIAYSKTESVIKEIEAELPTSNPSELRAKVNRIFGYITPELNVKIDVLHTKIDDKEAELEIARIEKESLNTIERIEKLFLSISDSRKRQECLERLQKLP